MIVKKKSLFFLLIVISLSLFLSGCGFKDIDDRIFVIAIGVDPSEKEEGHYKVTLKLAIPLASIKQEKTPTYQYITHEGENIAEALRLMETHTDKVLEFGHLKTIVINESLLKENIKDFMDYFFRRGDIQLIAWIAAAKTSAEEILHVEPKTEAAVTTSLAKFFDQTGTESPYIVTSYLFEFRRNIISKGIDAVIPILESNEKGSEIFVNESLVIKEGREPFELDSRLTRAYNVIQNNLGEYSLKIQEKDKDIILDMDSTKMKYKIVKKEDGVPASIQVNVQMTGAVSQSNKDLFLANLRSYNKTAEKKVVKDIEKLLQTLQEEKLDPFGFGLRYRTMQLHQEGILSKWEEAYPTLPIKVHAEVKIKGTGSLE